MSPPSVLCANVA